MVLTSPVFTVSQFQDDVTDVTLQFRSNMPQRFNPRNVVNDLSMCITKKKLPWVQHSHSPATADCCCDPLLLLPSHLSTCSTQLAPGRLCKWIHPLGCTAILHALWTWWNAQREVQTCLDMKVGICWNPDFRYGWSCWRLKPSGLLASDHSHRRCEMRLCLSWTTSVPLSASFLH